MSLVVTLDIDPTLHGIVDLELTGFVGFSVLGVYKNSIHCFPRYAG